MSLGDNDMSPHASHRLEMEQWGRDENGKSFLHYDREDWEAREAAEQDAIESVEAEEARWEGIFRRAARERVEVIYDDSLPGVDRRCFDVSGMRSVSGW